MSVDDSEQLARFIPIEVWINQGQIKGDAFRPTINKRNNILETSVQRHDGQDLPGLRKQGFEWASKRRNPKFFGWANVNVKAVRTVNIGSNLDVEDASHQKNKNHANIVGWHLDTAQQFIQAEEVARKSVHQS